jgi:hypothetical protein
MPARADSLSQASELFAEGRTLRLRGECPAAIALFRQALQVYPAGLGSLRNIAECDEIMDRYASARREWSNLKRALIASPSPRYDGWTQDADAAAGRLLSEVSQLVVELDVPNAGSGDAASAASGRGVPVRVTVNDEAIDRAALGVPMESDPGRYIVRAMAPDGRVLEERVVDLAPGASARVQLNSGLPAEPARAEVPQDSHVPMPPRSPAVAVGWAAIGIGGASLVGSAVSLAFYLSAHDTLEKKCPNYQTQACDPSVQPVVSEGRTASTLVNVFTAVGVAGVVGGAALVVALSPRRSSTALVVSPTGVWATGQF